MIRKIAKASMAFFLAAQVIADVHMVKSPKIDLRAVPIQTPEGAVAGFNDCDTDHCCDFCWVGTSNENNCPAEWQFDNDCDCGCQFVDDRCQLCDYCWGGSDSCPAEWQYDLDCDCGCQWPDCGCTGFGKCVTDDDCPDDLANCTDGYCDFGDPDDCLDDVCATRVAANAVVCRAATGSCDEPETCDGTAASCPADAVKPAGAICRPDMGDCDVAESCDGTLPDCPPDGFVPASPLTECRTEAGVCDAPESCDGAGPDCPADTFDPPTQLCRAATDECDAEEYCTGAGPDCPADALKPAGFPCDSETPDGGDCDAADFCNGASAVCLDALAPAGTVCRSSAGECDPAEECDGISADCPADVLEPDTTVCGPAACPTHCSGGDPKCPIISCGRVSISKKGSLLYYSKIELRWNATAPFAPRQDTFLTIVNDYPEPVCVQWYFINGDDPTAAVFAGSPPILVERAHKGCNQVNCTTELSANKSTYMSALTGGPLGCQPFSILDPGTPPGRPDPENPGRRILRGYAIAFAVDCVSGAEISWNHLSGHVDIVNYANRSAWEYNAYAFQCVADPTVGNQCGADPGTLHMDGAEYDYAFDKLLFDFYAAGSFAFSMIPTAIQLDTDLTLHPVSVDLRTDDTDSDGPVLTRAKFDIWNQNEDARSGVNRCITCWDQALLSNYAVPNNFLIGNLQTNKGKARIDGIESDDCDAPGACCCTSHELNNKLCDDPDCDIVDYARGTPDRDCSEDAALLGVSDKILFFSGAGVPAGTRTDAGMTLVGQGIQEAVIKRDLVDPPDPLTNGLQVPDAENTTGIDDAALTPVRAPDRSQRRITPYKK